MTRTDQHRPSEIIPADYCHMFAFAYPTTVDGWPVPGLNLDLLHKLRVKGEMAECHKSGPCDICGATFVEGSVFRHDQTGEYIAIGHVCADKMELHYDASAVALMKRDRKAARKAVVMRIARFRGLKEWARGTCSRLLRDLRTDHHIVENIRERIIQNAAKRLPQDLISEKQAELVRKIARETRERAEQPEEVLVPAPVSDERLTIEGVVLSCKTHDSGFGPSLKMTIKVTTDDGSWLCWGTAPDSILGNDLGNDGLKGCTVRFAAKLVAGGRDEHFAFFKRPTKAVLVKLGKSQAEYVEEARTALAEIRVEEGGDMTVWEIARAAWVRKMEKLL